MASVGGKVSLLDLVEIKIKKGQPQPWDKYPLVVELIPYDKDKQVVFDEKILQSFNQRLAEYTYSNQLSWADPKAHEALKEYVGRFVEELYKMDLVALEEIPEGGTDPYAELRK